MKTFAAIALTALAVAGCGSSSYGGGSSSSSNSSASAPASTASSSGLTVYTFSKDTKGVSNCSGACATNWPPASSAPGLAKSKITTIKRADGSTQVAYNGKPLYHFVGDKKPGDMNGNGLNAFGGLWTAAKQGSGSGSGSAAPAAPPSSSKYGY